MLTSSITVSITSTNAVKVIYFHLLILSSLAGCQLRAQSFRLMRFDEDYHYLAQPDSMKTGYDHIKFVPLSKDKSVYVSFGGEMREEFDAFNNEDWGLFNAGKDNFLLERYDLHSDWHFGNNVRFFFQLRSALENGRPHGPRPIDEDRLNIQNLFIDFKLWHHLTDSMIVRAGRQELNYGAGRLISVREGPNVRLYFNGLKLLYAGKNFSADAFVMEADSIKPGALDNTNSKTINLWGIYSSLAITQNIHADLYYIGNHQDRIVYDDGTGAEIRHTVGARLWKISPGFTYDVEACYQFGTFHHGPIRAWTASFDLGYSWGDVRSRPVVGIRNDYISGDRRVGDGRLETFNPIYPKGGYFGFDPQVGPVNLIDIHPYGWLFLFPKFQFLWDVVYNWRYSPQDGIYRPSGVYNLTGIGSSKRYIGTDYLGKVVYTINPFLEVDFGVQYFVTGPFIDSQVKASRNALETNTRIAFKF
jgi:hypothetical protein